MGIILKCKSNQKTYSSLNKQTDQICNSRIYLTTPEGKCEIKRCAERGFIVVQTEKGKAATKLDGSERHCGAGVARQEIDTQAAGKIQLINVFFPLGIMGDHAHAGLGERFYIHLRQSISDRAIDRNEVLLDVIGPEP